jgi:hypothetical protein
MKSCNSCALAHIVSLAYNGVAPFLRSVPDTSPFDRGSYIKTLSSYSLRQTIAAL